MPKIVDWESKRDDILSATWRVIARDGIAGTTIRAIAREADCSRGILGHYLQDKADILGSALLLSHRRVGARMAACGADRRPERERVLYPDRVSPQRQADIAVALHHDIT
jgi:AcrR family transcriptional regulator